MQGLEITLEQGGEGYVAKCDAPWLAPGFRSGWSYTHAKPEEAVRKCAALIRKDVDGPVAIRLPYLGKTFDIPFYDRKPARLPIRVPPPGEDPPQLPHASEPGDDGEVLVPIDITASGVRLRG